MSLEGILPEYVLSDHHQSGLGTNPVGAPAVEAAGQLQGPKSFQDNNFKLHNHFAGGEELRFSPLKAVRPSEGDSLSASFVPLRCPPL